MRSVPTEALGSVDFGSCLQVAFVLCSVTTDADPLSAKSWDATENITNGAAMARGLRLRPKQNSILQLTKVDRHAVALAGNGDSGPRRATSGESLFASRPVSLVSEACCWDEKPSCRRSTILFVQLARRKRRRRRDQGRTRQWQDLSSRSFRLVTRRRCLRAPLCGESRAKHTLPTPGWQVCFGRSSVSFRCYPRCSAPRWPRPWPSKGSSRVEISWRWPPEASRSWRRRPCRPRLVVVIDDVQWLDPSSRFASFFRRPSDRQ